MQYYISHGATESFFQSLSKEEKIGVFQKEWKANDHKAVWKERKKRKEMKKNLF